MAKQRNPQEPQTMTIGTHNGLLMVRFPQCYHDGKTTGKPVVPWLVKGDDVSMSIEYLDGEQVIVIRKAVE